MNDWSPLNLEKDIKLFSYKNRKIAYKYYNRKTDSKTVLFLYGFGANILMADQFAPSLAELGYTVLTIDYPGHGYSPKTDNVSLKLISEILLELLKELNEDRIILIGYSFGGIISLDFYSKYKAKIDKYILIHTAYSFKNNLFKKIIFTLFEKLLKKYFNFTLNYIAIPILRDFFFTAKQIKDARFTAMKNDRDSVIKMYDLVVNKDMSDALSLIECPTFIIGSNIDLLVSASLSKKMNKMIKDSKLKIFPVYGHYSLISKPKTVARMIDDFVKK